MKADNVVAPVIAIGQTYSVRFPFVTCVHYEYDSEGREIPHESWRPGCELDDSHDRSRWWADGHGEMLLEVVSLHKPGRYPERVFYTRRWKDPNGKVFGAPKLRMATMATFRALLRGYRHRYEGVDDED